MSRTFPKPLPILLVGHAADPAFAQARADNGLVLTICAAETSNRIDCSGYAAILIDGRASAEDAMSTARRLRLRDAATPIVFVTPADGVPFDYDAAIELGTVDFVAAPIVVAMLKAKISHLLALQRREDALRAAQGALLETGFGPSQLRNERAFLAAVLDAVEDGIVACDSHGVLTVFNRASRQFHGLPEAPLPAEQWSAHYHLYRADGVTPLPKEEIPLFRALTGEAVRDAEIVIATTTGSRRTVLSTGKPLVDDSGKLLGAVVSMHDVSARREVQAARDAAIREQARREEAEAAAESLRESRERFELLLESSGEGIYGMAADGRCTFINAAGAQMLGVDPDDLVGQTIHSLIHHHRADGTAYPEAECRIQNAIRDGAVLRVEDEVFWHRDGSATPVAYTVHPALSGGKQVGAVVNFSNIAARRKTEEQLRASEERVRLATDAAELGVWVWDVAADRVTWENDRLYAMFGLPRTDEPINAARFLAEFVHPDDAALFQQAIRDVVQGGDRLRVELRFYRRSDGQLRWAEFTGLLRRATDGTPLRLLGTVADITDRHQAHLDLRESEERYRTLFESIDEGFCIIENIPDGQGGSIDHRFLETNPAFELQSGLVGAVGKTIRELVPDLDAHWFHAYSQVARTGQPQRFEDESKAMKRWFDVYATRMGGAGSNKIALLFSDITARKHAEADLRRLAADLAEADRRKTEFLATLAHELRNPLAPIRNGLHLMAHAPDNAQIVSRSRDMMERQLAQLVRLVDDLLDIARITRGKVELKRERVSLQSVAAGAVETCMPLMESARHELAVQMPAEPLMLDVDPVRLAQVVGNLLNNAAKYTPRGGHIGLTAYRENGEAVVSVSDDGIGIPEESLGSVFDMFTQVGRNMERAQGGLGIGLTLVRRLVELHGGTASARSGGPGMGSEFTIRLPLAGQYGGGGDVAEREVEAGGRSRKGVRVLVVDDNVDAAESLAGILELGGHAIRVAHDGFQAIRTALEFSPEIAFLDLGMPGKNGYEVARTLRRTPGLEGIRLVALTGWGSAEDRARSKEAGFDQHLTKPAEFAVVDRLLAEISAAHDAEEV